MRPLRFYVACGLTQASFEFKDFVISFKERIKKECGIEIFEFVGLTAGTPSEVYETDIAYVEQADGIIAILDVPAIGLGMEIDHAINSNKPLLCLAHKDASVTRMIKGANDLGLLTFATYVDLDSAVALVKQFIATKVPTIRKTQNQ